MPLKKRKKHNLDNTSEEMYNEDIVFEEEAGEEDVKKKIKKLNEKLKICLKDNKDNLLGWQRARADFVNLKKESEERVKQSYSFARGELIEEILPVLDSFDMAFANKEAWEKVDKQWRIGVEYIHTQLLTIFKNNGLKQIDPNGKKFNPNFHTSMEVVDTDNKAEDETVVEVIQKGYELNGKVMRPAKVRVGQYKK